MQNSKQEGREEMNIEIAENLLAESDEVTLIARVTGLSITDIEKIKQESTRLCKVAIFKIQGIIYKHCFALGVKGNNAKGHHAKLLNRSLHHSW